MNTDLSNSILTIGFICRGGTPMAQCLKRGRIGSQSGELAVHHSTYHGINDDQQRLTILKTSRPTLSSV